MALQEITDIFGTKFGSMFDDAAVPNLTQKIFPKELTFDPSSIPAFKELSGSIYEAAQSFNNVFNSSLKPSDLSQLVNNGLSQEVSKLITDNGLSSVYGLLQRPEFNKTSYTYKESESKIKAPNLTLNYNPLNIFNKLIEQALRASNSSTDKQITDFYTDLNRVRKVIYDLNTELYEIVDSLLQIHIQHELKQYSLELSDLYNSSVYFDEFFTIQEQLKAGYTVVLNQTIMVSSYIRFIKEKEFYETQLARALEIVTEFQSLSTTKALKYAYEDLKVLRKTDTNPEFNPV